MASEAEMASLELAQEKEKQQQSSNMSHQTLVQQQTLPCPRCHSLDTKFCYFNNYNLAQPRHYCRSCKRYWTHGGTLRDVPIGGASRKTHLSSSSSNKRRRVTAPQATATPPGNHPQMEIISNGVDVTSRGFFMGLGLGPFGFEVLPGFDALQDFSLDHHVGNTNTRAFWTCPEASSNSVMTTTAATASFTVSGGGEGPPSAVDSPGVDRWRLEDALLEGGIDDEFNLSMAIPTKGLN